MINIIINEMKKQIECEEIPPYPFYYDGIQEFLDTLLNKISYGGETICLEIVDEKGNYTEVNRYYPVGKTID